MTLSEFMAEHLDAVLAEWDAYAKTMTPAADEMTFKARRDHAEEMLRAIVLDVQSSQSAQERHEKSLGQEDDATTTSAASQHGALRHASQFTLLQLSSEFRALRATVLRLWLPHVRSSPQTLYEVVRFNEAIDQALAESIVTFSARADAAGNLFVAILGHDLRGPLATVTLAGNLLSIADLPAAKVASTGASIKRAARQMTSMVDDLLGFARTRLGGGLVITPRQGDALVVCEAAVADASAMHPGSQFVFESSGPLEGWFDDVRLHQLLVNLLGNAGQHGTRGRPVRIAADGTEEHIRISVINEGPGIPAQFLERIFEPLVQLPAGSPSDETSRTSLGLGLHVAREIATGHGGSISVRSSDAEGTCFEVSLPRAIGTAG